ncbi:hypothetical protein [Modestobacter sp. Leaf380]|uniref:hypothetical protein n=1 Tax=Modestobacter sp. Leaf380 TaxID=1736356 RepID=UPI0006F59B9D|nr:hypothetical protein [Modestobacter sp. Leaf380]KQS73765.1 hypothetical protein ASG41_04040 [Modestobacter sp. Leaf380]
MNLRKRSGVLALLLVAMLGGGVAFAAWMVSGGGSVNGVAGTTVDFAVVASTPASSLLYPGGTADLAGTVTNPNGFPVRITQVVLQTPTTSSGTCTAGNITLPRTTITGLAIDVPANSTTTVLTLPAAVSMLPTAADGCKQVTFTVPVTATGTTLPV